MTYRCSEDLIVFGALDERLCCSTNGFPRWNRGLPSAIWRIHSRSSGIIGGVSAIGSPALFLRYSTIAEKAEVQCSSRGFDRWCPEYVR